MQLNYPGIFRLTVYTIRVLSTLRTFSMQVCLDVNECELVANGGCDEQRDCINTEVCNG